MGANSKGGFSRSAAKVAAAAANGRKGAAWAAWRLLPGLPAQGGGRVEVRWKDVRWKDQNSFFRNFEMNPSPPSPTSSSL